MPLDIPVDGADAFIVTTTERARDLCALPVLIHAAAMGLTAPPEEHLAAGLGTTGQPLGGFFFNAQGLMLRAG